MKSIYTLLFVLMVVAIQAQTTPCYDSPVHSETNYVELQRDFGDTITFDEYGTGTIITNEYYTDGAIFSGLPDGLFCDIYDYVGTYGRILKSSSWYDIIKLRFVDPLDTNIQMPIHQFGYENPIDSEIDYIVTNFYDVNDEIVYTYTSVSPEIVNIDLGGESAVYVTFDDDQFTAYVIDNVWYDPDTTEISDIAETNIQLGKIAPNPFNESTMITFPCVLTNAVLLVFDTRGRMVMNTGGINGNQYLLNRGNLNSGLYCFQVRENGLKKMDGNLKIE